MPVDRQRDAKTIAQAADRDGAEARGARARIPLAGSMDHGATHQSGNEYASKKWA